MTSLWLNEFFDRLGQSLEPVSASAWSQARVKFSHSAFIELNQKAIVEPSYGPAHQGARKCWREHRLVGIDSSWIHLPNTQEMGREFGWVKCKNQKGQCGRYVQGRLATFGQRFIYPENKVVNCGSSNASLAVATPLT